MAGASAGRRAERVAERVRQVVATFLREEARDPRISLVTITGVKVGADLHRAVVSFVAHGDEQARSHAREGLSAATPAIRRRLGESLGLRLVPELVFERDRGLEHAEHIGRLLADLRRGGTEDASS